ncbi:hypothetical protein DFH28DRAFT_354697 [Melampsora americana]|nr:hypothetical protein DFH28DRAFT_354697 [Melampsora americana]
MLFELKADTTSFRISRPYMHLFGKAIVVLLLVNQTFALKVSYTGLQEVEDTVRDAPYERLGSESYHPREAQISSDDKPLPTSHEDHRTDFESGSLCW